MEVDDGLVHLDVGEDGHLLLGAAASQLYFWGEGGDLGEVGPFDGLEGLALEDLADELGELALVLERLGVDEVVLLEVVED